MNSKDDLLILTGPTAVGKTSISINLGEKLNGEIISADSMQIYKGMDTGTSKITLNEMQNIPHHMLDIVNPDEDFTVSDFKNKAENHIEMINKNGKLPIVVGGTGLYINSLVYHLKFTNVESNEELRKKYMWLADENGNEYIHNELYKVDPISAKRIHINDRQRVIRALEIFYETGKPMSNHNKDFRKEKDQYNLTMVALIMERKKLYHRINERVDLMLKEGLVEEVAGLMEKGYNRELISMQGIGYKEIISYLEGEVNLDEATTILKRNTRRYAKRQLTWFKRDKRVKWIDVDKFNTIEETSNFIIDILNN